MLDLREAPQEKADLMKLVAIELLFDGENLRITPYSAFAELIKLKNSYKLVRTVY